MASDEKQCPIWGTPAILFPTTRDGEDVESPRAGGHYFVSGTACKLLNKWNVPNKIKLTSWLVEQRRLGVSCPEISSFTLEETTQRRQVSVHDRADALLNYLSANSELLGTIVKFPTLDYLPSDETSNEVLAWTASQQISEVITLVEYCAMVGWIDHRTTEATQAFPQTFHELMLKPPGFARLAELDFSNSGSKQAFVAMWFDDTMSDAYDIGIRPAIDDAGYVAMRIDKKDHNNKIDDEIIAEIRRSRFLVADFTQGASGPRGGVYYEAGFAHGLNIPVIFTCRNDVLDKVHFDTRQYNHLTWDNPTELRERLAKRISATLGDGPLKKVI